MDEIGILRTRCSNDVVFNPMERRAPITSRSCPAPKKVGIIIPSRILERAFMHVYFSAIVIYMKLIKPNWIFKKLQSRKRSQFKIYYVVDVGRIVGNRLMSCPKPLWGSYIIVSIVDRRNKFGLSTNDFSKQIPVTPLNHLDPIIPCNPFLLLIEFKKQQMHIICFHTSPIIMICQTRFPISLCNSWIPWVRGCLNHQ